MCRVLLKAEHDANLGRYSQGDFVAVFNDDHQFGRLETAPTFMILDIPGLDPSIFRQYLTEWRDRDGKLLERRQYTIDITKLISSVRSDLLSIGKVNTGLSAIKPAIFDKDTGEFETNRIIT